jgi:surface protein
MNFSIIASSRLRANPFIIEVDTSKAGSASDAFQFTGAVGGYDVVAKQSGVIVQTFSNLSGAATITFSNGTGIYVLEVTPKASGGFNRINFNNGGDKLKLTDVKSWGNVVWSSFERAFFGCSNSTFTAVNDPNLTNVNNMLAMFANATLANPNVTNWDVSNVKNMVAMFEGATAANPNTENWNVSSVTSMFFMFFNATSANPNVTNWDVSSVTNMLSMFRNAAAANPNMSSWNVSSVTNMSNMLSGSNLSTANLDGCYINWSLLSLRSNVPFTAGTTKFTSTAQSGRDILVNTYNWTITDGGLV